MRARLVAVSFLTAMLLGACAPIGWTGSGGGAASWNSPDAQQRRLYTWMMGSSSNPLLSDDFCGELVGHEFMLTAATEAGMHRSCTVPFGVPVLASPGGCFDWFTITTPDADVQAQRDADCTGFTNVTAQLDGRNINLGHAYAATDAYTVPIAAGSLVRTIDPAFADATEVRVASLGWMIELPLLAPGSHTLALSDDVDGNPESIVFDLTVDRPGAHPHGG